MPFSPSRCAKWGILGVSNGVCINVPGAIPLVLCNMNKLHSDCGRQKNIERIKRCTITNAVHTVTRVCDIPTSCE